jgi:glycine/D-amino acid oxidase-like deaminating enzyme
VADLARLEEETRPMKVAIVGAGVAGLVCALRLAEAGIRVAVFERSPRLGAGISCLSAELLPLWSASPHLFACARRLGLSPRHLKTSTPGWTVAGAGTLSLRPRWSGLEAHFEPEGRFSGVERRAASRALRRLLRAARHGGSTLTDVPLARAALSWGDEAPLRLLWRPLCRLLCLAPADETTLPRFARLLAAALGAKAQRQWVQLPDSFVEWFAVPLARALGRRGGEVAIAAPVHALEPADGGWRLPQTDTRRFDHLVLAVSPWDAAALLQGVPGLEALCARLSNWPRTPLWSAIVPRTTHGWCFTPEADAWRAPAGGERTALACLAPPGPEQLLPLGEEAPAAAWRDDLFPLPASAPVPLCPFPGLWLAGGWMTPEPTLPGAEAAAASGWRTAAAILRRATAAG